MIIFLQQSLKCIMYIHISKSTHKNNINIQFRTMVLGFYSYTFKIVILKSVKIKMNDSWLDSWEGLKKTLLKVWNYMHTAYIHRWKDNLRLDCAILWCGIKTIPHHTSVVENTPSKIGVVIFLVPQNISFLQNLVTKMTLHE